MRTVFIVILDPLFKLCHDRFYIGPLVEINMILFGGLDEGFGNAVEVGLLTAVKQLMRPKALAKTVASAPV